MGTLSGPWLPTAPSPGFWPPTRSPHPLPTQSLSFKMMAPRRRVLEKNTVYSLSRYSYL